MVTMVNRLSTIIALVLLLVFSTPGQASSPKQPKLLTLSVFIEASGNSGNIEAQKLRTRLGKMPGIIVVEDKQGATAEIEIQSGTSSAPATLAARPGPGSSFLEWEPFDAPLTESGLDMFVDNLHIVQRLQGPGGESLDQERASIYLSIYEPGIHFDESNPVAVKHILVEERIWQLSTVVPVANYIRLSQAQDRIVLITAQNNTQNGLYIYGINITPNGKILVFSPHAIKASDGHAAAYVAPQSSKNFDDFSFLLNEDTEGIYIVQSSGPLDFSQIESGGFNAIFSTGKMLQDDTQSTW